MVLGSCSPILREAWQRARDITNAVASRVLGASIISKGEDASAEDIGPHGILAQVAAALQYALAVMTQVGAESVDGAPVVFVRTGPTQLMPMDVEEGPRPGAGSSRSGNNGAPRVESINPRASLRHLCITARNRLGINEVWLLVTLDRAFVPDKDRGRYALQPVNDVAVAAAQGGSAAACAA